MYRTGHYGVALVAYAPLGALLLAVATPEVALLSGAAVLALTPLPDYDQRIPLVKHRGGTHTVAFAVLVGVLTGLVGWALGAGPAPLGPLAGAALGAVVGVHAILAHLAADAITPAGIRPLWPVSDREFALGWVRAANPLANYGLLAAGAVLTAVVLWLATRFGPAG